MSEEANERKRKRISRACLVCRKKKVRCDGNEPCANCTSSKKSCVYEGVKSEKPKKKLTNRESINTLDLRLEKLEGLLEYIAGKLVEKGPSKRAPRKDLSPETEDEEEEEGKAEDEDEAEGYDEEADSGNGGGDGEDADDGTGMSPSEGPPSSGGRVSIHCFHYSINAGRFA